MVTKIAIKSFVCSLLCMELLTSIVFSPYSNAQEPQLEPGLRMEFGTSEPCGLLRFMDSIAEERDEGPALGSFFRSQRPLDAADLEQIQRYKALSSAPGSQVEFTTEAGRKRNLQKQLKTIACEFNEFDQFYEKAKRYCAPDYFSELKGVLTHFRPLYEQQIWLPCKPVLESDVDWFKSTERDWARPLEKIRRLFQSPLSTDPALKAILVPVPYMLIRQGNKIHIKSEAANSEASEPRFAMVSVNILAPETAAKYNDSWLTNEAQTINKCTLEGNSVLFHEFVHLIWAYRKQNLKKAFYDSFRKEDMIFNYDILNEAQACALAAWFYKNVSGKEDEGDWYDNKYVSRYAHALRPVLEEYIDLNHPMDGSYARKAMKVFEETFPDWQEDPQVVLWRSQIVAAQDPELLEKDLSGRIFKFNSGNHEMRVLKGKTWSGKRKEFLQNPRRNTIFFLKPNQLDLLSQYFGLSESVVSSLEKLRSGSSCAAAALLAGIKTPQRWLIFCISDELKDQESALENLAKSQKMITSL